MNLPMNHKPMKMKLLILLCMAALPAMSARAAGNTEKPAEAKILPDGVYRVRGEDSTEKGVTVKRCDTDGTVILLDRLTSQFGTASMTSAANDNTRFLIDFSKPDTYKIEGRFEMNIARKPDDCMIFGWDEVAQGTTMVTLGDGGAAVEDADPAQVRAALKQGVETSDELKETAAPTGK